MDGVWIEDGQDEDERCVSECVCARVCGSQVQSSPVELLGLHLQLRRDLRRRARHSEGNLGKG